MWFDNLLLRWDPQRPSCPQPRQWNIKFLDIISFWIFMFTKLCKNRNIYQWLLHIIFENHAVYAKRAEQKAHFVNVLGISCSVPAWKISFSGPYSPAFGLNVEFYRVNLRGQYKCEKLRTKKAPNTYTF